MGYADLARDLLGNFAHEGSKRGLAWFNSPTWGAPVARAIAVPDEKNATSVVKEGSENTDRRHTRCYWPNYNLTKVCFVYFGSYQGGIADKAEP
jgi:hypothetical protein